MEKERALVSFLVQAPSDFHLFKVFFKIERRLRRVFARLTNGFSKKAENNAHSVAIHFMHYSFVRIHQSLRVTPAMAAGVTGTLWSLTEMVRVIEDWEAARAQKSGDRLVG